MGRDFTPKEQHFADKQYGFSRHRCSFIVPKTGEEKILYDPESEFSKKYPNLSFLCLEAMLEDINEDTLAIAEKILVGIMENDTVDERYPVLSNIVSKWYDGKLDPAFYYSETNHSIFANKLKSYKNENKGEKTNG